MGHLALSSRCRVFTRHDTKACVAIRVRVGEPLTVGTEDKEWPGWLWYDGRGRDGWVPVEYLHALDGGFEAARDYDATELRVEVGDCLTL